MFNDVDARSTGDGAKADAEAAKAATRATESFILTELLLEILNMLLYEQFRRI